MDPDEDEEWFDRWRFEAAGLPTVAPTQDDYTLARASLPDAGRRARETRWGQRLDEVQVTPRPPAVAAPMGLHWGAPAQQPIRTAKITYTLACDAGSKEFRWIAPGELIHDPDPLAELVKGLEHDGKPSLVWAVRHAARVDDPVAFAWRETRSAGAMRKLCQLANKMDSVAKSQFLERYRTRWALDQFEDVRPWSNGLIGPDISPGDRYASQRWFLERNGETYYAVFPVTTDGPTRQWLLTDLILRATQPERAVAIRRALPTAPVTLRQLLERPSNSLEDRNV